MSHPEISAGHYMYVRHTDAAGNKTVFQYRVWNNEVALNGLAAQADAENKKAREKNRPALAKVESIDEATYRREK